MTRLTSIRPSRFTPLRSTQHDRKESWFLSADEKKRLVDVFVLLNKLDTRLRCKAASSGKSTKRRASRESKQEKARDMICLYIKGRGPCFIDLKGALRSLLFDVVGLLFYLKATEIFNQGCIHDRYYSSHLNTGYV